MEYLTEYVFSWGKDGGLYYIIYSVPLVKELIAECGYSRFEYKMFEMDFNLPKPENTGMGTYTVKTEDNERLQISRALLMPLYLCWR